MRSQQRKPKGRVMARRTVMTRDEMQRLPLDSRLALIQALIPLGLMAVQEELLRDVEELAGLRYGRKAEDNKRVYRHGTNPGSVKLAGQRVGVEVPRVRDEAGEVGLPSYQRLHEGTHVDEELFRRVLYGISCRDYEAAAVAVPGAIGLSKSTVSQRFIEASQESLKLLRERDLSSLDVVAMFIDGKTFAEQSMVIALGILMDGTKVFLGFIETDTENDLVLREFLRSLLGRGLRIDQGLLVLMDGGKGLRAAVRKVFAKRAVVQRCQWHKRENIVAYLPIEEQAGMRRRLQKAYERPTYDEAKKALLEIDEDLKDRNQSAAASLQEGFEETLTLHRLGVFAVLGRSFKTTNCLESINAQVESRCERVDYWKNSSQRQRWLAAALLDIEPRLRKVMGHRHLPLLRQALQRELKIKPPSMNVQKAA